MQWKRKYFFIVSLVFIGALLCSPGYKNWFWGGVMNPGVTYLDQFKNLDPEVRRILRYGNSYTVYMESTSIFRRLNIVDPLILLPPPGYLKEKGVIDVDVVEPSEFYYYTGYRAVWANSPGAEKATWTLVPDKTIVMLRRIHGREDIDRLLNLYKQYKSMR